ncbi:CG9021 [Drosophila busckii]|uniref:CG9021 n=2 Tax=Drosophila busckii TaxID=30019 RepID=A0A0M4ENE9_DROBS|nr:CG9021 [Drosophila busckii]
MYQLLIYLSCCCLLLVAASSKELEEDVTYQFLTEQEQVTEPAPDVTEAAAAVFDLPRDGNTCPTNSERGLTRLIRNARAQLPIERMRNILANARDDAEVAALLRLVRSDQFKERVQSLRSTKEQGVLRDYICRALRLNHSYFLEFVRSFINTQATEPASSKLPQRRPGVRGLLLDLRDALPRGQLRDMYRRQLAADRDLADAVRRLRGPEFRRLLSNVRALAEYRVVRTELEKAGVPLQALLNLVSNALGWGNADMGSEVDILSA